MTKQFSIFRNSTKLAFSVHIIWDHSWRCFTQPGTKRRGEGILRMEEAGTSEEDDDIDSQDSNTPIDHGHQARNCSIKIITPAVKACNFFSGFSRFPISSHQHSSLFNLPSSSCPFIFSFVNFISCFTSLMFRKNILPNHRCMIISGVENEERDAYRLLLHGALKP